jgi:hypothetical protein
MSSYVTPVTFVCKLYMLIVATTCNCNADSVAWSTRSCVLDLALYLVINAKIILKRMSLPPQMFATLFGGVLDSMKWNGKDRMSFNRMPFLSYFL